MKKVVSDFFLYRGSFLAFLLSRPVLLPLFYALIVVLLLNLSGRVKRACILFISIGARTPLVVIRLKCKFLAGGGSTRGGGAGRRDPLPGYSSDGVPNYNQSGVLTWQPSFPDDGDKGWNYLPC